MSFELSNVVPWGRNTDEYCRMFSLSDSDLDRRIVGFGDGPASFNGEMTRRGKRVISVDPVYRFSREELAQRIAETREEVMAQVRANAHQFVWRHFCSADELERTRMAAMQDFLDDFEAGKQAGRYQPQALPHPTTFSDQQFDLALSSHFLLLYSGLGLDFHLRSIQEMLRVSREIRIFPILNLRAQPSELLDQITEHYRTNYEVSITEVDYEFQKNGNQMLTIKLKHGS